MILNKKIDFIMIGPGKAGTSWLFNVLSQHPEVHVSSSKETMYFERYYQKGETWYHNCFAPQKPTQKVGEISNTYIFNQEVPSRIHAYRPDIKLITSLRNPVERTFSHFLFMKRVGEFNGTFEEALEARPDLITRGNYSALLKNYYQYFSKEQLLILLFDDLKINNELYFQKLANFLNLEVIPNKEILDKKVLPAGRARNQLLSQIVKKMAVMVRDAGYAELVTKIKFNKKITNFFFKEYSNGEKPTMKDETRSYLKAIFKKDAEELSELTGQDMVALWELNK